MSDVIVLLILLAVFIVFHFLFGKEAGSASMGFIIAMFIFGGIMLFSELGSSPEEDRLRTDMLTYKSDIEEATNEEYENLEDAVSSLIEKYDESQYEIEDLETELTEFYYQRDIVEGAILDDIRGETEIDFYDLEDAVNYLLDFYCQSYQ